MYFLASSYNPYYAPEVFTYNQVTFCILKHRISVKKISPPPLKTTVLKIVYLLWQEFLGSDYGDSNDANDDDIDNSTSDSTGDSAGDPSGKSNDDSKKAAEDSNNLQEVDSNKEKHLFFNKFVHFSLFYFVWVSTWIK